MKLELFYKLLVKDIISGNAVNKESKSDTNDIIGCAEHADARRDVIEISNSFKNSKNFYLSYFTRTITELLVASGLYGWLVHGGYQLITESLETTHDFNLVLCNVYGDWYECTGHP